MQAFAAHLAERVRTGHADLMRLARRRVDEAGMPLTDEELEQLVHGFEQLLLEALEEAGTATRDFFVETAIPAIVASGRATPDAMTGTITAWAVVLSVSLVGSLPEEEREAGTTWLSRFFDGYAAAAARVMREMP